MSLASEKKLAVTEHQILFVPHFSFLFFLISFYFFVQMCLCNVQLSFPRFPLALLKKKSPNVLPFHRGSVFQQKTWRLLRTLFFMSRKRQRTSLSLMCNIRISFIRECFKKESVTSKRSLALHLTPVFFPLLFLLLSLVSLRVCSVVVGLYLVLLTLFQQVLSEVVVYTCICIV